MIFPLHTRTHTHAHAHAHTHMHTHMHAHTHTHTHAHTYTHTGEDDSTIVENLSQKLDPQSSSDHPEQNGDGEEGEEGDQASRLGALRKKFLSVLLNHVYLIEIAGGMRAITFMQVRETQTVQDLTRTETRHSSLGWN